MGEEDEAQIDELCTLVEDLGMEDNRKGKEDDRKENEDDTEEIRREEHRPRKVDQGPSKDTGVSKENGDHGRVPYLHCCYP